MSEPVVILKIVNEVSVLRNLMILDFSFVVCCIIRPRWDLAAQNYLSFLLLKTIVF